MKWQRNLKELQVSRKEDDSQGVDCDFELEDIILRQKHKDIAQQFRCGNDYIDRYIKRVSWKDKSAVTYAMYDKKRNRIVAIMTLVASGIYTVHSAKSSRPNRVIPAVEIRNFAVDEAYQHLPWDKDDGSTTLSKMIFSYYMSSILEMSKNNLGIERIVLYSVDKAVSFYKNFGFREYRHWMARANEKVIKDCTPMYFCLKE